MKMDSAKFMKSDMTYPEVSPFLGPRFGKILSTGMCVPDNIVDNNDIIQRFDFIVTDRAVQYSTGIRERRWVNDDSTLVSDLLVGAARQCLERANLSAEKLDRIIYSRLIGERILPSTAIRVLEKLGVNQGLPAFDITAGCSGMIHAIDMGLKYIESGDDYILILGGDITSRSANENNQKDTRTIFLIGDAIAGVLLGPASEQHFMCSYFYTDSTFADLAYIPFGTELLNNEKSFNNEMFNMLMPEGKAIHDAAVASGYLVAHKLLEFQGMTSEDIDFFVTSDQTTFTWAEQLQRLGVPQEKSLSLFCRYGNTVAAMCPLVLNELIETGRLQRGMTVLMMAHGAGASGGGFIFKY